MSRLGMPGAALGGARGRCLGERLTAYADRAMDAPTLLHWDRHVVTCLSCSAAVSEERRVLAALRSSDDSTMPGNLRGMLLAMAASPTGSVFPDRGAAPLHHLPPVPVAPVRVVDRGAPAMHRSARRSTVFAGLAAGATAAAAWGLVLTGGGLTASATPTPSSTVRPDSGETPRVSTAAFSVPAIAVIPEAWQTPTVGSGPGPSAQSLP